MKQEASEKIFELSGEQFVIDSRNSWLKYYLLKWASPRGKRTKQVTQPIKAS